VVFAGVSNDLVPIAPFDVDHFQQRVLPLAFAVEFLNDVDFAEVFHSPFWSYTFLVLLATLLPFVGVFRCRDSSIAFPF